MERNWSYFSSLCGLVALLLVLTSVRPVYAVSISLPYGSCPSGTVMTTTGGSPSCGVIPANNTVSVDAVEVTAPRLNPDGTPYSPSSSQKSVLPVADPSKVVVPSGWGAGNAGNGYQPIPPNTAGSSADLTYTTSKTGGTIYSSPTAACSASWAAGGGNSSGTNYAWTNGGPGTNNTTCKSHCTGSACTAVCGSSSCDGLSSYMSATATCPSGYTNSSGTCTLSNASSVQKPLDGSCNVIRVGNSFSGDPSDPDCTVSGAPTVGGSTISSKNGSSNATVKANSDGSTSVTNNYYDSSSNTTTSTNIQVGSDGKVTGISQGTTTGDVVSGTAGAATVNIDTSALATHGDVAATTNAVNSLGTKLDVTNTHLNDIKSQLTVDESGKQSALNAGKDPVDTESAAIVTKINAVDPDEQESLFDEVGQLLLPFIPSQVSCSPWSGNFQGKSFSFDWCPYIDKLNSLLGWLLALFSAFTIWQIAMRDD